MKASASVELLEHVGFRAVARGTASIDGLTETVTHEIDLGTEPVQRLRAQRGEVWFADVLNRLPELARGKALGIARDILIDRMLTPEEREERRTRRPEQPMSPGLAAKHERRRVLCDAVCDALGVKRGG
jgi:hypothetical protein